MPAKTPILLLDTSAIVYLVEGSPARRSVVEKYLKSARLGEMRLWVSAIAWMELLSRGAAAGGKFQGRSSAEAFRILLSDSATIVTRVVDVAVAEEAARLRRLYRLGSLDAIHIATARIVGADAVLGNDAAWRLCPECPEFLCIDELAFESGV
jgi:predicted nucleic acid-binding protein